MLIGLLLSLSGLAALSALMSLILPIPVALAVSAGLLLLYDYASDPKRRDPDAPIDVTPLQGSPIHIFTALVLLGAAVAGVVALVPFHLALEQAVTRDQFHLNVRAAGAFGLAITVLWIAGPAFGLHLLLRGAIAARALRNARRARAAGSQVSPSTDQGLGQQAAVGLTAVAIITYGLTALYLTTTKPGAEALMLRQTYAAEFVEQQKVELIGGVPRITIVPPKDIGEVREAHRDDEGVERARAAGLRVVIPTLVAGLLLELGFFIVRTTAGQVWQRQVAVIRPLRQSIQRKLSGSGSDVVPRVPPQVPPPAAAAANVGVPRAARAAAPAGPEHGPAAPTADEGPAEGLAATEEGGREPARLPRSLARLLRIGDRKGPGATVATKDEELTGIGGSR